MSGLDPQFVGVIYTTSGLVVLAIIGVIGNLVVKWFRPRLTQPEIWKRIDDLTTTIYGDGTSEEPGMLKRLTIAEAAREEERKRNVALGNIIRDLAHQWEGAPPRLSPSDLAELDVRYIPETHPWRQPRN